MWKDAMKKSATMQQVEPPKKRQKVAPSPPSVKDGDRILLIRRTISFAPLYGPSYSSVFDGLDCSERSISLDVDYNIKATDSGQGFWTPHGARPREEYPEDTHQRLLSIYLKGETHCLLAITYHVNDLSEDAQVDLKWVIEIRNDLNRPKDPVVEYQSSSTLTLKLDDQGRWSLELLVRVSVDPANEWSPRFLELSRIKYWQLFQHSLPIGKPDMKLVQRHNRAEIAKTTPITPREFYLSTHVPENTEKVPDSVQHIELNCELLPFQRRAVSWMLGREGVQFSPENPKKLVPLTNHFQTSLPPTFFDQKDMNGQTCYASHIMGIVTKDLEGLRRSFESDQISRSGVLAEEMVDFPVSLPRES